MSGAHLSSMWEQVSKTTNIACKEQNRASPSAPKQTNCLQVWIRSSPMCCNGTLLPLAKAYKA